ncbi:MAG: hypothetical protein U0641_08870 [Anaerolineae bacterium]
MTTPSPQSLDDDLRQLAERLGQELSYNDGKGRYPYRQGMHDGLKFAYDSLVALLREHDILDSAGSLEGRLEARRSDEALLDQLLRH